MRIVRLKKAKKENLKDLNHLLTELSSEGYQMSFPFLKKLLSDKDVFLAIVLDKKTIVGMGTLISAASPTNTFGLIEDVVVEEKYRGKGLGRDLMNFLIEEGRRRKLKQLKLTSKKDRIAANLLYQKLGFYQKETNVYRMKL